MKRVCLLVLAMVVALLASAQGLAPTNSSGSLTLAWTPDPPTNYVASYTVYYGTASATYMNKLSSGTNTTLSVSNLVRGRTYYFAATATGTNGLESDFSSEVYANAPTPPLPPTVLRIVVGN